ncbi:MAG: DUF3194 domain-containing protein [Candidatus Nezhaarchaeales archaeon]
MLLVIRRLSSSELAQLLEEAKTEAVRYVNSKTKKGEVIDISVSIGVAEANGYTFDVDVELTVQPFLTLDVERLASEAADKALSVIDRYFKRLSDTRSDA